MTIEYLLLGASGLLLLSVIASKASGRMGVPALLLFLGIGMWLEVDEPWQPRLEASLVWGAPTTLKSGLLEIGVPDTSPAVGRRLLDLGLPKSAYVVLIARKGRSFVPDGSTVIEAGDSLLVFADHPSAIRLRSMFGGGHQESRTVDFPGRRQEEAAS